MALLSELKRRNVFRVALLYAVSAWVLLQVGDLLFDALDVPPWGLKLLLSLLLLGFPVAIAFSWVYELTPEGLKREHEVDRNASITSQTASRLNVLIVGLLVLAIGLVLGDRFFDREAATPGPAAASSAAPAAPTGPAAGASPADSAASIAVLPFVNMSEEKANEYFSDGLTEELLNVLANVPGLRVIARTSSFAYKGKDVKIADVARELDVDHVLEGSVRKAGNRVRITTQLIRASDSSHLWSKTYDRDLNDIFAVQDEISDQVVDALKLRLLQEEKAPEIGGTHDAKAYEAYLHGRFLRNQGEAETTLRAALAAFDEAIDLDPAYARAHAARAEALGVLASNAYLPFESGFEQARQSAKHAIELAPDLAEGYLTFGFILFSVDLDSAAAAAAGERALALNPGSFDVQRSYASFQSSMGRHDAAIAAAEKAVELDPIAPQAYVSLSSALVNARLYEKAEAVARRAVTLAPERPVVQGTLGLALHLQGRRKEALVAIDRERLDWIRMTGRALVFASSGQPDLARAELSAMQEKFGDAASYQYAQICAVLGDHDEAFRWLANARRVRDPGLMGNVLVDPVLDPLRKDPRFDELLRELGFTKNT
jgi:TolB-like protein/Tfp pilus assembly protein PilF